MSYHSDGSLVLSLPSSQPGSKLNVTDGQRSFISTLFSKSWSTVTTSLKKAWLVVAFTLREIWSPLAYHVGGIVDDIRTTEGLGGSIQELLPCLGGLVLHLMLCLTATILLPISLPRKLIMKGKCTPTGKRMLVISCIAMAVDPLFFYIPFIDENKKCIGMDKTLRAIVLALRSLADLAFTLHIAARIQDRIDNPFYSDSDPELEALRWVTRRMRWLSKAIIIDFIAILPVPQVTIIIVFFRMNEFGYLDESAIGTVFLLLQFITRGCQIYHFQKQFKMLGKWASAFYFLMYILAGHVLGAFWYFLSIQREISCWHHTCKNITGCVATNYCEDTSHLANITLLNEMCPINPSNATLFDFGVFLEALQSGNTGPISFSTKYFYTFWWGIRNLSNFGTNLEASNYLWENCFTILLSLVGLILFLYLMGNVQTYILWESTKALQVQEVKVNAKYEDLDTWMLKNDVPQEMKTVVVKIIKHKQVVEKNYAAGFDVDVDVDLVFHAIIADGNYSLLLDFRKHFCLDALKKVFILQNLRGFNSPYLLFNVLHPVIYEENSYVVRAGDPDDRMLIITQGVIVCTDRFRGNAATAVSSSMIPKSRFEKGEVYGGQLLTIEVDHPIPISSRDVKCHTKVEAFALTSDGLKSVVEWRPVHKRSRLFDQWNNPELVNKTYRKLTTTRSEKLMQQQMKMNRKVNDISKWLSKNNVPNSLKAEVMKHARGNNVLEKDIGADVDLMYLFSIDLPWDLEYLLKKHLCMSTLYKVPVLKDVDEDVLHRICMSLEPVILPENSCIVNVGDVIHSMLIIIEGEITSTNRTSEYVVGEELLSWALPDEYISNSQPATSTECVKCCAKVEAFALTMDGLESVLTYYNDGINKFEQLENSRDGLADAKGASTSSTIEQKLDQLIQLHGDILHQHRDEMANQGRRLDDMAAFLAGLGYSTVPPPPSEA